MKSNFKGFGVSGANMSGYLEILTKSLEFARNVKALIGISSVGKIFHLNNEQVK